MSSGGTGSGGLRPAMGETIIAIGVLALAAIVGGLVLAWAIAKQRKRRAEEPPRTGSSSP